MPETFAEFSARLGLKPETRFAGTPHECRALLPFPDHERANAYRLADFYVSASVSGPALEFRPRETSRP